MSTTTMHFGPEWMRTKPHAPQPASGGGIGASGSTTTTFTNTTNTNNLATTPTSAPTNNLANMSATTNTTNTNSGSASTPSAPTALNTTPSATGAANSSNNTNPASTYSALVSSTGVPGGGTQFEKHDEAHPFRYSREELLRIYREGGGKGGLGLEVERWEGVVRETGSDPVGLREMSEAEKKLWSGSLNSEIRRRQSTADYSTTSPLIGTDRSRLTHTNSPSVAASPMRERFGPLRRRDSTDSPTLPIPRKQSLSSLQLPSMSPRDTGLPSPRTRVGYTPFDGVLNSGESWMARRRTSEASKTGIGIGGGSGASSGGGAPRDGVAGSGGVPGSGGDYQSDGKTLEIPEEEEDETSRNGLTQQQNHNDGGPDPSQGGGTDTRGSAIGTPGDGATKDAVAQQNANAGLDASMAQLSINPSGGGNSSVSPAPISAGPPPGLPDLHKVEWSYKDPTGQVQGPFPGELMQKWYDDGYFTLDLPMKRTHLDTQWTTVEELARRAMGEKIFLSPQVSQLPPGLAGVGGPGGGRRTDSPLQSYSPATEHSPFNAPYQPAPIRSLRSTTLDSYLGNGSNPSDSPSSSFGAGRFSNGSPDPSAFGGRTSNAGYHGGGDIGFGGQSAAFGAANTSRRNTFSDVPIDPGLNLRSSPFGGTGAAGAGVGVAGRAPGGSIDGYGFNNYSPWGNTVDPATGHYANINPTVGALRQDGLEYSPSLEYANVAGGVMGDADKVGVPGAPAGGFGAYTGLGGIPQGHQFGHSPGAQFIVPQHVAQAIGGGYAQHGGLAQQGQGIPQQQSPWGNVSDVHARRPGPFDPATGAPIQAPMTPIHHHQVPQASPWGRQAPVVQQQQPQQQDASSWYTTPQEANQNNLPHGYAHVHQMENNAEEVARPTPGTADAGLAHSNQNVAAEEAQAQLQQQQQPPATSPAAETGTAPVAAPNVVTSPIVSSAVPATPVTPAAISATATVPPIKSRTKSSSASTHLHGQPQSPTSATSASQQPSIAPAPAAPTPAQTQTQVQTPAQTHARVAATPSPPPPIKTAWSTDETKPSGVTMSLREIQEAEAKKAEARKAAERERAAARAAATASPNESEDVQPFTASWGLPTSQAGAARGQGNHHANNGSGSGAATGSLGGLLKEGGHGHHSPSSATSSVASTPWTNAPKAPAAKKSMKEIQEEEERRKKHAQEKAAHAAKESQSTGAAAAARRGYAETTTKSVSPSVASPGNAWTTVGPSGKTTAVANHPARPTLATATSSGSVPGSATTAATVAAGRVNGSASSSTGSTTPASRPATTAATIVKQPPPQAPKQEDTLPGAPSHEFLRWLTESLKGLNSSVNVEEIMSMLLSFPPDDSSTAEIISDLIYANSTTMDGRRYASEFITKRKVDVAASKSRGGAISGAGAGAGTGGGSKTSGKPISIADVVKAAPKPTQPEWGGFKVVNKKKKGGRS